MGTPSYNCFYNPFGDLSRIVYNGQDIPIENVYDLCWRKPSNEPYAGRFRLPKETDYFIQCNPRGTGNHNIDQARKHLLGYLEGLKKSVDAAHPYTTWMLEEHNHPSYDDDYYDDDYYPEDGPLGWETLDDAELVLANVSYSRVPVYAVKLSNPVQLRNSNDKLRHLRKWEDSLLQAKYHLAWLFEEDGFREASNLDGSFMKSLLEACEKITAQCELEMKNGRAK